MKLPNLHLSPWSNVVLLDNMFSDQERRKIITIIHTIWSTRNKWTHGQFFFDPKQAMRWVRDDLAVRSFPVDHAKVSAEQCWRPPDTGWIKINTDSVVDVDAQRGGEGGVPDQTCPWMLGVSLF